MRLRDLYLDGFGVHRDLGVGPFVPGMNVILGPNEAGKSTLCEFVRALFFGFDSGRRSRTGSRRHEPLRGGRHGGRATLEGDRGERFTITLRPGARRAGEHVLARADGTRLPPEELEALVGPVTRTLFEHVHAFGLEELTDLRALAEPEMDDYLFGATARTDPRRLSEARGELDDRLRSILSVRGSGRLGECVRELGDVRDELARARQEAAGLPRLQAERAELGGRIEEGTRRLEVLAARRTELDRLVLVRPAWMRREKLRAELERLRGFRPVPREAQVMHGKLLERLVRARDRARAAGSERNGASDRFDAARPPAIAAEGALLRARRPRASWLVGAAILGLLALIPVGWALRALVAVPVVLAFAARWIWVAHRLRLERDVANAAVRACERALDERQREVERRQIMLGRATDNFARFHAAFGCRDEGTFATLVEAGATRTAVRAELAGLETQLGASVHDEDMARVIESAPADLAGVVADMRALARTIDAQRERKGSLEGQMEGLRASDRIAKLRLDEERLLAEIDALKGQWTRARLAKSLLEEASRRFQERHQPVVLRTASAMLTAMTAGEFRRVLRPSDLAGGRVPLVCERRNGEQVGPEELSRGTREQLYLALRLAALKESVVGRPVLPLVMDDVLVNFDDERLEGAVDVIAELTRTHQVLYLTCHRRTAELIGDRTPGAQLFDLGTLRAPVP